MERLRTLWWRVVGSLWLLPSLMVVGAILLAIGLIEAEGLSDTSLSERWPRLFGSGADGARGMLTAIASSMITVAGTVFSVTIVALSLAASQYSPRVLRAFTSDRLTQVVLGVFVGIFVYCLVVLRTIRGAEEFEFVPSLAVMGGLVLALVGIAFLVFFIHHLAQSIQASSIVSRVAAATNATIEELFPDDVGCPTDPAAESSSGRPDEWTAVAASATGYVIHVNSKGLLAFARHVDRVVRMRVGIGDFVIDGQVLAEVEGAEPIDAAFQRQLNANYSVDVQRTITQDAAYGIQQLVDIACKALSPAMNDASTAGLCIDRLTEILVRLARRRIESPRRVENGRLRVIALGPSFDSLVDVAYVTLCTEARASHATVMRLLWSLEQVAGATERPGRRAALVRPLERIVCEAEGSESLADRQVILQRASLLRARLAPSATDS